MVFEYFLPTIQYPGNREALGNLEYMTFDVQLEASWHFSQDAL